MLRHGLPTLSARNTAMIEAVAELPPIVVADLFGIHPSTAYTWAKLAQATGVRACYHTHSGNYLGSNGASMRLLLQDQDPHFISAYVDTGHVTINGNPLRQELETLKQWLALVAIKDMLWEKQGGTWERRIVPAGEGIVRWAEVRQGLKDCGFDGTISLHAEYETNDPAERQRLAREELAFLRKALEGKAK